MHNKRIIEYEFSLVFQQSTEFIIKGSLKATETYNKKKHKWMISLAELTEKYFDG